MVIDMQGNIHQPAGLPKNEAGAFAGKAFSVGDRDLTDPLNLDYITKQDQPQGGDGDYLHDDLGRGNTGASRDWRRRVLHDPRRPIWDSKLLAASEPMRDKQGNIIADYTDDPVMTPEEQVELVRRATYWTDDDGNVHHGPIYKALASWFPNEAACMDAAVKLADERMEALRLSCVNDPAQGFSRRFAGYSLLKQPVRMESILAKDPYRLSAHRMRVGKRFLDRLKTYQAEHGGRLPNARQRDRIWNENMADFVDDKMSRGVDFGRGMAYTNGRNADPRIKSRTMRRTATGGVFNGRRDFETMLAEGMAMLQSPNKTVQELVELHGSKTMPVATGDTGTTVTNETEEMHAAWRLARDRGYDMAVFAERSGLDPRLAAQWEREET